MHINKHHRVATRGLIVLLAVMLSGCAGVVGGNQRSAPDASAAQAQQRIVPVAVERSYLDGLGLVANSATEDGDSHVTRDAPIENSSHTFHAGKIFVAVYESAPGRVHINNAPFDEFVHILEGRLILTLENGESWEFKKGDSLVVPKGYVGYWHMPEKYRELIVIDTSYAEPE